MTETSVPTCAWGSEQRGNKCTKPAFMALKTNRPNRDRIYTTVDYDDRSAPKNAERLCRQHGIETMISLIETLVPSE